MVFKAGFVLLLFSIIRLSLANTCEKGDCVSVPVLDNIAAPLTAQLDIRELNKQIGDIINEKFQDVLTKVMENITDRVKLIEEKLTSEINKEIMTVGITACVKNTARREPGTVIDYPNIKSSTGISAIFKASFTNSGVFTCQHPGLYFVAVTTVTHTTGSRKIQIYKKGTIVKEIYVCSYQSGSTGDSASTGITTILLQAGDTLYVQTQYEMMFHQSSCLTIMKIN